MSNAYDPNRPFSEVLGSSGTHEKYAREAAEAFRECIAQGMKNDSIFTHDPSIQYEGVTIIKEVEVQEEC